MTAKRYHETFDGDAGGWMGWVAGGGGPLKLELIDGALVARSPWGVDINHAPPGAGYMHLIVGLMTMAPDEYPYQRMELYTGVNRFVSEGHSRDFTDARFTVRVRGDVDLKGADYLLALQAQVGPIRTNWVLTGQPIRVGRDWSEQTLRLTPDPSQWTDLGVRTRGADCDFYGTAPIADALRTLNVDIMLVIAMLDVAPARPIPGDPHAMKAGREYPIDRSRLPSGELWLDSVTVDYAR